MTCGWHQDVVLMTCGWHADDMWMSSAWCADDMQMSYVICQWQQLCIKPTGFLVINLTKAYPSTLPSTQPPNWKKSLFWVNLLIQKMYFIFQIETFLILHSILVHNHYRCFSVQMGNCCPWSCLMMVFLPVKMEMMNWIYSVLRMVKKWMAHTIKTFVSDQSAHVLRFIITIQ